MIKRLLSILLMLFCIVSFCFANSTKQFEFFDNGTYIVPEDFPDKFLGFSGRALGIDIFVEGRGGAFVVEHEFSGSPGTILFVTVIVYAEKGAGLAILYIQTVTAVDGVGPEKWVTCEYADIALYETGKPSRILTKIDKLPSYEKFRARQVAALTPKVEI